MDRHFEARQIRNFEKMALDGLIFQGLKPIYWSPYNETAIADSEIVYIDKTDPTIYVSFDVADGKGILDKDDKFVIWTTTPWTIPANLAICLNPDLVYAEVQTEKGKLIMLECLADSLLEKFHLENQGIARILPNGIEAKDGSVFECDVIVCATGFNVAKMLGNLTVKGAGGRDLGAEWGEEDARSYMGMCVPGYPNYFHTVGPNSAPNHAAGQNLISECQVNWIIEALDRITEGNAKAFEVTQQAYEDWNRKVEARMPEMIWSHPRASSYYMNSKRRIFLSWPWRLVDFFNETRAPAEGSYLLHR